MKDSVLVWMGFAGTCVLLTGLSWMHKTHGLSVDSGYYLQSARNLLAGRGYTIIENGQLLWNSTFPVGYSLLIATLAGVVGIPVLIASKVINMAALGFSVWRWTVRLGPYRASWFLSVWLLGGFLKIAAYTWSETVFLVLLAEWIWAAYLLLQRSSFRTATLLFGIGCALFMVRYVGGFVFGLSGILALLLWFFPRWSPSRLAPLNRRLATGWLFANAVAGIVFMCLYFWLNQQFSGSYFGGDRFLPTETPSKLIILFSVALLNEFLFFRDFVPSETGLLAWTSLFGQTLVCGLAYRTYQVFLVRSSTVSRANPLRFLLITTGVTYLLALFVLRSVSPFDGPNLRLMAPFTACLLQAILLWVSDCPVRLQYRLRPFWLLLLLGSWLQFIPRSGLPIRLPKLRQSQHSIINKSPVWASIRTKPSCSASLLLPVR